MQIKSARQIFMIAQYPIVFSSQTNDGGAGWTQTLYLDMLQDKCIIACTLNLHHFYMLETLICQF